MHKVVNAFGGLKDPSLVPRLEAGLSGTYNCWVSNPWYACRQDTQLSLGMRLKKPAKCASWN